MLDGILEISKVRTERGLDFNLPDGRDSDDAFELGQQRDHLRAGPSFAQQIVEMAEGEGRDINFHPLQFREGQQPVGTSSLIPIAQLLRDRVVEIVDEARVEVFAQFPQITEPGGGLYPPERAEACWRDFWHYLRPISYGISGGYSEYTSAAGLENMRVMTEV